jgi:hypothetical protein
MYVCMHAFIKVISPVYWSRVLPIDWITYKYTHTHTYRSLRPFIGHVCFQSTGSIINTHTHTHTYRSFRPFIGHVCSQLTGVRLLVGCMRLGLGPLHTLKWRKCCLGALLLPQVCVHVCVYVCVCVYAYT